MIGDLALYLAALFLLAGALFSFLAAVGILRLPDLYTRMHAASKAGTVGAGFIFLAVAIVSGDFSVLLRALIGIVFVALTAPVAAHLLARSAYQAGYRPGGALRINELEQESRSER